MTYSDPALIIWSCFTSFNCWYEECFGVILFVVVSYRAPDSSAHSDLGCFSLSEAPVAQTSWRHHGLMITFLLKTRWLFLESDLRGWNRSSRPVHMAHVSIHILTFYFVLTYLISVPIKVANASYRFVRARINFATIQCFLSESWPFSCSTVSCDLRSAKL